MYLGVAVVGLGISVVGEGGEGSGGQEAGGWSARLYRVLACNAHKPQSAFRGTPPRQRAPPMLPLVIFQEIHFNLFKTYYTRMHTLSLLAKVH